MIVPTRSRTADNLRVAVPPAILALAATLLLRLPPAQHSFYPRCPIYELFHLQCPGCGATRSIAAMLRGDFAEAMKLNGLVTLLLPFAAAYGILCYTRLLQRKPLCWPQPPSVILYTALSVATLFTMIRNLPPYSY